MDGLVYLFDIELREEARGALSDYCLSTQHVMSDIHLLFLLCISCAWLHYRHAVNTTFPLSVLKSLGNLLPLCPE